ncbi:PfkB family carbohydrate kinase [[Flexibacter] sp. ATCC 35208]|uniref:PfkB family carbohydrate kinase n=1 Tax=[Flexibacter] sp. ATCC 35208 TaxID=1936242 RepID=UPI0009C4AEB0|nr:PfkB family carbohydrate kinase [[Flexibacter] sp. ATCC 35208]OMP75537.1 ribokinase [[Flexibacter] sp. ATCC 35208]
MYDICCIGHITLDKVVTTRSVVHMPGGTSFYFSSAIRNMDVKYAIVTALATKEMYIADELRAKGTEIVVLTSTNTLYFENIYSENQDHRTQRVSQLADPFTPEQLSDMDARFFHLGPLVADDIPVSVIRELAKKGKVSLDVQGYLRKVENEQVIHIDWPAKKEALQYVYILKANESEMEVLTGTNDVRKGAITLASWGVKEVIITLGSRGSVVYKDQTFYDIPAYIPTTSVVDATGCGDTYMAGYLYQRAKNANPQDAGEFAAAMATLKIEGSGPFRGNAEDVTKFLAANHRFTFSLTA